MHGEALARVLRVYSWHTRVYACVQGCMHCRTTIVYVNRSGRLGNDVHRPVRKLYLLLNGMTCAELLLHSEKQSYI